MKSQIALLLLSLCPASALASQSYLCKTSDFDPKEYWGESLTVTMTDDRVTEIKVNPGCWVIDGKNEHPKVLLDNEQETVYDCLFGDSACKLTVSKPFYPTKAIRLELFVSEVGGSTFWLHCSEQ
jgi:hypothetical protein